MSVRFPMSQRDIAYQPRVQPWEWDRGYECVLKERRMDRARVGDTTVCGVPSERVVGGPLFPGRCPGLVCVAPLGPESHALLGHESR